MESSSLQENFLKTSFLSVFGGFTGDANLGFLRTKEGNNENA